MGIKYDNARDGTLKEFFSCHSTNMLGCSRASSLDSLGVGWEEHLLPLYFPIIGGRLLSYASTRYILNLRWLLVGRIHLILIPRYLVALILTLYNYHA